jgi:hypothetical protein
MPQAIQLLQDNLNRRFRIDIETDSTVRADMSRSQEQMNLFMQGTAQFVQGMTQAAQIAPQMLPAMIEVYLAFARRFKLGKQAEDAIESLSQMGEQLAQMAQQQQSQPSPEEVKAKQAMALEEKKAEIFERTEMKKLEFDRQKNDQALQFQREKQQLDMERADWQAANENARAEQQFVRDQERGDLEHTRKLEQSDTEHRRKLEMGDAEHGARMTETRTKDAAARKQAGLPMEDDVSRDEAMVIAQGIQSMGTEMRQANEAIANVVMVMVEQLTGHMAEQTKAQREIAQQNLKVATARRRLVKNPDGSKETELVM